jgi:hypothetical protein
MPCIAIAQSGSSPVIAKSRSAVDQVDSSSGKIVNHRLEYGMYYQRSDGSYVRQNFAPGSQDKVAQSTIYDTQNGVLYQLDYITRRAVGRPIKIAKAMAAASVKPAEGPPQLINGVECTPYPVYGRESGKRVRVGTIWQTKDGLVMRYESSLNQGTVKGTMVSELYDVQFGHEPDADLFKVPAGFTGSTDPKASCSRK